MAIKFSQFVVETDKANVNYLVGWDGAENVQITPADLLGSYPSGSGATGQVAFFDTASSIGGDNDLFFDNTNKRLGIGTTSPVTKLHIADVSTPTIRIEDTTNNKNIQLFHDNNNSFIRTSTGSQLNFQTDGNNDRMIITTSGNVGIGTTSPVSKLQVEGSFISSGISQLGSAGANVYLTSSSAGNVGIGTSSPLRKLSINGGDVAVNNGNSFIVGAAITGNTQIGELGANSGQLQLLTESTRDIKFGSTTYGNIMFLEGSNGNVGIGTDSPAYKLAVYGSSTDSEIVASFGSANDVNEYTAIGLSGFIAGNDATKAGLALERTASFGVGKLHFLNNSAIDDSNMTLSDSRMVIDDDGYVGIGTTVPASKLEVDGGDIEVDDSASGLILRSPDGTRYRVTVANGGTLSVSAV
jgi:hypothetical protein